ncbi:uncharacterized protein LOC120259576 [Dioscorea cayenensis subsp. rotundata]|uniref:Uncharacterized protein LOC120259576 n=1 Tax=Dioscorea cayennensis subsp. rotundata TaxID=55577 RepID=A0AB40B7B1_DIOCR|nr:uncharacterized protein LOC120259576 [Dioscorea cayenensis subsp. rotundata]
MKLVWCPEMASKAYIGAVKALADGEIEIEDSNVVEMVSAMAGGWRAEFIVEAWSAGVATSLGLATAAVETGGKRVCMVSDERTRVEYEQAMEHAGVAPAEVVVGEGEERVRELEGVDFMVVDMRRRDAARVLGGARPGLRGMVVVCKSAGGKDGGAVRMMGRGTRVVRTAFLPIGGGLEILHVGVGKGPGLQGGCGRWIKRVDRATGELHVFRR